MPRKRERAVEGISPSKLERIQQIQSMLPEGWEIIPKYFKEGSDYAIVKIRIDDINRIKLVKLPKEVRDYFKKRQREYRKRLKKKKK